MKAAGGSTKTPDQLDAAVRQLVSGAITTEGKIIDVFTTAGLPKPDISILSDQFLVEVRGLKHKNVAAELLAKLLKNEVKVRSKRNLVQSRLLPTPCLKASNRNNACHPLRRPCHDRLTRASPVIGGPISTRCCQGS